MRSLLRLMRPDSFEDISAVLALYRPGPMGADSHTNYALRKNGRQEIQAIHRELAEPLAEILEPTYGLIVYQEQVLAIVQKVAGYSLGQADLLRKAMGKKKREILDAEFVPFERGMQANGYSAPAIKALWDILVPFSDYAFNKAHTAAYGLVSYWTAYLKAHYPQEYMAALLTSVKDDKDKMAVYLNECRRMKIQVLPPDVNESDATFTPVGGDIRFGLTAIRNVGANVVDKIVEARRERGRFTDFNDFMDKVDPLVCNKRVIESLVKGGAFDEMGHGRRALVAVHEQAVDRYATIKKDAGGGQDSLFDDLMGGGQPIFDMTVAVPDIEEWDKMTLLGHEREMLGLYVSDHPLMGLEHLLAGASDCSIGQLLLDEERPDNSPITVTGLVTAVQRKITKKGDTWAVVTLEDLDGAIEVLMFPGTYQLAGSLLAEDAILTVRGRLSRSKETPEIRGEEVTVPDLTDDHSGPGGGQPADHPLHSARGRPAQGGPAHPSRGHRGPPPAAGPGPDHGDAGRRQPPRRRGSPAVRRPQAAPRARVPQRMSEPDPAAEPAASGPTSASAAPRSDVPWRFAIVVLSAYVVVAALCGVVWERLWTPPVQYVQQHQLYYVDYAALRHVFDGTGLYVASRPFASAAVALVVCLAHPPPRAGHPGAGDRRLGGGRSGDA